ncbi:MAG: DJ-1/PfpI family protein [Melioribacteraceae bacterium]|jgi:protease I|nr:DJ-1/PfpI family protein [Melioribacteraceae bacterium]
MSIQKKSILLFLAAENFCEQEFLTVKNIFLRKGFNLFISSDANSLCVGGNGMKVKPDVNIYNINKNNFGAFVIIGGKGIINYWDNQILKSSVLEFNKNNKIVASICAAGVIIAKSGILNQKEGVVYPDYKKEFDRTGVIYKDQDVVVEGKIITAKNPASSVEFADAILNRLN